MMYRIFFILFLLAAMTPESVRSGFFGLGEEEVETVLVFLLGMAGFVIFFFKERTLSRHVKEKLLIEREKTDMTRDLSDSYSYIGETNRKLDLLRGLILSLPEEASRFRLGETRKAYRSFEKSVLTAAKSAAFLLRIIDTRRKDSVKEIRNGKVSPCTAISIEKLLSSEKRVIVEDGCVVVRSSGSIGEYVSFLMFPKTMNRHEDTGTLEALATQGLILFFLERDGAATSSKEENDGTKTE
jgi:hypothetical protein